MSIFRWGIFGTGAISAKFVAGLAQAPGARAVVIASRAGAKARAFADAFGVERCVGGYAEAAEAGGVDAIYIATPPALHRVHAIACMKAGVPVLIEKPFATDVSQAREIVAAARHYGVFCMEGMWTRFLPAAKQLHSMVLAGAIGEPRQVVGSFGTAYAPDAARGNFDPTRGGGALAHLGIYPISLAQWLFGAPTVVSALARFGDTGVDEEVAMTLAYAGGVLASFHTSLRAKAANDFRVLGLNGSLSFRGPIYRPYGIDHVSSPPRRGVATGLGRLDGLREGRLAQGLSQLASHVGLARLGGVPRFYSGNGYHYEADEVRRCVADNLLESTTMPLDESIEVMATVDRVRRAMSGADAQGLDR